MSDLSLHESFALLALVTFLVALLVSVYQNKPTRSFRWAEVLNGLAVLIMGFVLTFLWIKFERPPMRSIGETRLWYAFFLPLIGGVTYRLWKYRWFLSYSLFMGMVFLMINLLKPEINVQHLPPALQSAWFVPHVIVYILGYSLLAASAIIAVRYMFMPARLDASEIAGKADNMVYAGFSMISLGLIFGALWAKVAWGDYWSWDPKETWALISWLVYLTYMHCRMRQKPVLKGKQALVFLILAFVILLIAWMGMKFLPAAEGSVHTYG
jgi:ABC-type transport system involved in cytochrome c biogenesis permease subunit